MLQKEKQKWFPTAMPKQDVEAWRLETAATFRVTKMKFGKTKDASGKSVNDKTTVIYNDYITLKNIPLWQEIYDDTFRLVEIHEKFTADRGHQFGFLILPGEISFHFGGEFPD